MWYYAPQSPLNLSVSMIPLRRTANNHIVMVTVQLGSPHNNTNAKKSGSVITPVKTRTGSEIYLKLSLSFQM